MNFILYVSDYVLPLVFIYIIGFGLMSKVNVYDEFIKGAKDGLKVVLNIVPTLIGLMVAVGILRASGTLEIVSGILSPITDKLHVPSPIVPVALMRTVSSSASTGLVLDIFETYGPDSIIGRMTSIMMACTESIFYTMSVYFMSINIKKTKYTLSGALFVSFVAIVASVIITYRVFG